MRTITKTFNVYAFDELSDEAKKKALENSRSINIDYDWWRFIYDDAIEIGKILGIDIDEIYFSGFASQGNGACFEGHYSYAKESVKKIKSYAPKDDELHRIASELQRIQKLAFYSITARVKQSGHYVHERCTDIDVDMAESIGFEKFEEYQTVVADTLRDFMQWIYRILEKEYDYQTSDEAIIEMFQANEYEFMAGGKMYTG